MLKVIKRMYLWEKPAYYWKSMRKCAKFENVNLRVLLAINGKICVLICSSLLFQWLNSIRGVRVGKNIS